MAATVWSNVTVEVQSALAAAVTVNALSKANPGVVEHAGADPTAGDFVVFPDLAGMFQMRDRVARVANVNGAGSPSNFEVEGIDTTGYSTFTSGTFQVITFGTTLATATDVNATGGEPRFADATTIHDQIVTEIPTVTEPFEVSFDNIFDAADAALIALNGISDLQNKAAVRITFNNGNIIVFYGYVIATLIPTGSALEVVKTNVTLKATGRATLYAS